MSRTTYNILGMRCKSCVVKITNEVEGIYGVTQGSIFRIALINQVMQILPLHIRTRLGFSKNHYSRYKS